MLEQLKLNEQQTLVRCRIWKIIRFQSGRLIAAKFQCRNLLTADHWNSKRYLRVKLNWNFFYAVILSHSQFHKLEFK